MILVRDIFQVKFGKMKDAKEVWKEMFKVMPASGQGKPRLFTDLTGHPSRGRWKKPGRWYAPVARPVSSWRKAT